MIWNIAFGPEAFPRMALLHWELQDELSAHAAKRHTGWTSVIFFLYFRPQAQTSSTGLKMLLLQRPSRLPLCQPWVGKCPNKHRTRFNFRNRRLNCSPVNDPYWLLKLRCHLTARFIIKVAAQNMMNFRLVKKLGKWNDLPFWLVRLISQHATNNATEW